MICIIFLSCIGTFSELELIAEGKLDLPNQIYDNETWNFINKLTDDNTSGHKR